MCDPVTMAIVGIGFSALSSFSQMSSAQKQAKALTQQGDIEMQNRSRDIARKAASTKVSFLNSGLTLEGSPMSAISGIFDSGISDLSQLKSNYDTAAKSKISEARTKMLTDFAGGAMSMGSSGMFNPTATAVGSNSFMSGSNLYNTTSFGSVGKSMTIGSSSMFDSIATPIGIRVV